MSEPTEALFSDEITEVVVPGEAVTPHMRMGDGCWALCTYEPVFAGTEPRTEVVRPGQLVPQTLASGSYEFARGVLFRLVPLKA
jgi:hypothetical protein